MFWAISFPVIVLIEGIYLVRHPRGFNWIAVLVGLGIGGLSYLFLYKGESFRIVFFTQVFGVGLYYFLKGVHERM